MVKFSPQVFLRLLVAGILTGGLVLIPSTMRASAARSASHVFMAPADKDPDTQPGHRCKIKFHGDTDDSNEPDKHHRHACHATFAAPPGLIDGDIIVGPNGVVRVKFLQDGFITVVVDRGAELLVFDFGKGSFVVAPLQDRISRDHTYALVERSPKLFGGLAQSLSVAVGEVKGGRTTPCVTPSFGTAPVAGCEVVRANVKPGSKVKINVAYQVFKTVKVTVGKKVKFVTKRITSYDQSFTATAGVLGILNKAFPVSFKPGATDGPLKNGKVLALVTVTAGKVSATTRFVDSR